MSSENAVKPSIQTLTLCANRSCCRLRPVRNLEKDVGAAEARVTEESARCIFGCVLMGRREIKAQEKDDGGESAGLKQRGNRKVDDGKFRKRLVELAGALDGARISISNTGNCLSSLPIRSHSAK